MTCKLCWEKPSDRPGVLELLGQAFPEPSGFFADIMSKDPWYHYCQRRLLKVDGQILSNVDLFTRKIWIGGSPVLVGDLGNVSTHPDHRRKGYCSAVVNDLISYMDENGYGFSTVYAGAPEFYEGLGWRLFPEKRGIVKLKRQIKTVGGYEVREMHNVEDLPDLVELYDRSSDQKTGTTIRDSEYWRRHFDWLTGIPNHLPVVYKGGEMIGFGRYSAMNETVVIKEIGYLGESAGFLEVFIQIVNHIHSAGGGNIGIGYFTPDHPLASPEGDDFGIELYNNPTLRMRLINMKELFSNMLPCLAERLKKAGSTMQYENCITIGCEVGGAALSIRRGELEVVDPEYGMIHLSLAQKDLIRLLLGQADIRDIELEKTEKLSEGDIEILNILFPVEGPLYWQSDHF